MELEKLSFFSSAFFLILLASKASFSLFRALFLAFFFILLLALGFNGSLNLRSLGLELFFPFL